MMRWKVTKEGVILSVKVVPKSHRSQVVGWAENELKIKLAAVPEKGEANQELIRTLSKELHIPQSSISIVQGETSRHKKVLLQGADHFVEDWLRNIGQ